MILPDFFCIGVQKSGTTLLYEHLKKIDEIYLPNKKELHFFDSDDYMKGFDWYSRYFVKAQEEQLVGEITPAYIFIDNIAKKMYESPMKNLKFVVILRNPIERAYSHYTMRYRRGEENHSFEESFNLESRRTKNSIESLRKYSYFQRGFYSHQIENYFKYFDKSQFLFLLFEEFILDQDKGVEEVCNFLGVIKKEIIEPKKIHSSSLSLKEKFDFMKLNNYYNPLKIFQNGYPKMSLKMYQKLQNYYKNDIIKLEKTVNKDLSQWLQ